MKIGVTGASGLVGHPLAAGLLARGHEVVSLGRRPPTGLRTEHRPYTLDAPPPDLAGLDALVHAAFSHVPGRYRGGEGDDPEGFRRLNEIGTLRLFEAAGRAGLGRVVFLSSRAVYGDYPPGTALSEDLPPRPDTLYGEVKWRVEGALAALPLTGVSLRATGVYGPPPPGARHKWADLFDRFARGEEIAPRAGTEVHADDLAEAVHLVLTTGASGPYNVSDLRLDRRDLLALYAETHGLDRPLPPRAGVEVSEMRTDRLRALGWSPRGWEGLREVVATLP
ncbi:NAD-dependent epimerase/dehydratase family protein [Histidinibacterium aquaticum]|uniref:NAD(P)-dependent oxidoreductase n=1 Tax=Histidinibacterium aquaticum TaxID=2613962 RepID=A0A5J5GJ09_9RHOB|nr:NAD(P)-dependent oxidoreductase [Histidinibacterium aquaticum]KAA9008229.1 NAD(P)-dependent oxidoreductase [Histidinibacterium aquaticum]